MRLRRVEVQNWACIRALTLPELADGIVVLSGPNRTGKSSLVQAIRSCLFDHEHNSKDSTLTAAIPQRTKSAPQVAVEFEMPNGRFRITKVFSTRKEGQAVFEQQTSSGWTVVERGKEATKKVRELLGVEKSQAGLYQLLWLQQGEVRLPQPKDVDRQLAKAVETVLGTMITGADLEFKAKLDKACERWFTATMRDKEQSPLPRLAKDVEQARAQLAEIERQFQENEQALVQYENAQRQQPRFLRELEEAEKELQDAKASWDVVRERQFQHQMAERTLAEAQSRLSQATARRDEWRRLQNEESDAQTSLAALRTELESGAAARDAERTAAAVCDEALGQATKSWEQHQQSEAEIRERLELLNLAMQLDGIDKTLARVAELQEAIKTLEQNLAGPPPLSEQQEKNLHDNRRQATDLRARLDAAQLQVTFQAEREQSIDMAFDGGANEQTTFAANEERTWHLRHQGVLKLPGAGTIRIARGAADQSLEEMANRLAQHDRNYQDMLAGTGIDPNDPSALSKLTARRLEHQTWTQEIKNKRGELERAAPRGRPALDADKQAHLQHRQNILKRHVEWEQWLPSQRAIEELKFKFNERAAQLKTTLDQAQAARQTAVTAQQQAETRAQQTEKKFAEQRIKIKLLQDRVAGLGTAAELEELVAKAAAAVQDADAQLKATALTEAERDIETRHRAAEAALNQRRERLRKNELDLHGLQVRLVGTEGLHQKRINAEQTLHELTQALQREQRQADTYRYLKEVFEQIRQEQVQRTVGPVSDRVLQWMHHIGIDDYSTLDYDGQLFPKGLVPRDAAADESRVFDRESYGTLEQLSTLVRLAVGGLLAKTEPAVAILDDPFAHSDPMKHRRVLEVLQRASRGGEGVGPAAGPLQLIIFTCHPDRFDYLPGAMHVDLTQIMQRE